MRWSLLLEWLNLKGTVHSHGSNCTADSHMKPDIQIQPVFNEVFVLIFITPHVDSVFATSALEVKDHDLLGLVGALGQ